MLNKTKNKGIYMSYTNKILISFILLTSIGMSASEKSLQELQIKQKGIGLKQRGIHVVKGVAHIVGGTVGGVTAGAVGGALASMYTMFGKGNGDVNFAINFNYVGIPVGCTICCLIACPCCEDAVDNFKQAFASNTTMKRD
jgi:hypothetical protein